MQRPTLSPQLATLNPKRYRVRPSLDGYYSDIHDRGKVFIQEHPLIAILLYTR